MKYTLVFKWPDGQEPAVSRADTWKGGELCAVRFGDGVEELRGLNELCAVCNELEYLLPKRVQDALAKVRP
jgi:hypothetical protein